MKEELKFKYSICEKPVWLNTIPAGCYSETAFCKNTQT